MLLRNQRPALTESREHGEIEVAASLGDLVCLGKGHVRGAGVALEHDRQRGQEQEPAPFGAVLRRGLQHAPTAGDPPHCRGELTPKEQGAGLPKRAPRGAADLASAREPLVRAQPGGCAVVVLADQVGGKREPLQVLRLEGQVALRGCHQSVGIGPPLPPQCLPPLLKGIGCGHQLTPGPPSP